MGHQGVIMLTPLFSSVWTICVVHKLPQANTTFYFHSTKLTFSFQWQTHWHTQLNMKKAYLLYIQLKWNLCNVPMCNVHGCLIQVLCQLGMHAYTQNQTGKCIQAHIQTHTYCREPSKRAHHSGNAITQSKYSLPPLFSHTAKPSLKLPSVADQQSIHKEQQTTLQTLTAAGGHLLDFSRVYS